MVERRGDGRHDDPPVAPGPDLVFERALSAQLPTADVASAALALRSMRFGRLVERQLQELLRPTGLERSEFSVLASLLLAAGGQSPTELSRTVVQTTSGMTKTVNRLEGRGLVDRRQSAVDARRVDVVLTADGRRMAQTLLTGLVAGFSDPLADADPEATLDLAQALSGVLPVLESSSGVRPTGRARGGSSLHR